MTISHQCDVRRDKRVAQSSKVQKVIHVCPIIGACEFTYLYARVRSSDFNIFITANTVIYSGSDTSFYYFSFFFCLSIFSLTYGHTYCSPSSHTEVCTPINCSTSIVSNRRYLRFDGSTSVCPFLQM